MVLGGAAAQPVDFRGLRRLPLMPYSFTTS
jgi:hypothetical protein